jgi:tRNA(Arg) A34 adenosine deaminase TadA
MSGDNDAALVRRLLDVIEGDILPLTEAGVRRGNKIFGAAILRKSDRSLVLAETNNEIENPLWHGEVHALKRFHELPAAARPDPKDCLFLATHEPCPLCLAAITWGGYDNFYYLFSHAESRDSFAIPHDLRILKEVFGLEPGGYRARNFYWTSYAIPRLVADLAGPDREKLEARLATLAAKYAALSRCYQENKAGSAIPLN